MSVFSFCFVYALHFMFFLNVKTQFFLVFGGKQMTSQELLNQDFLVKLLFFKM